MNAPLILVPTCQKYGDAWEPFLRLLAKAWPDRPPVCIASDSVDGVPLPSLREGDCLRGLDDTRTLSWCEILRAALDVWDEEFVLLMQEDFFVHRVQPGKVADAFAFVRDHPGVACFRVYPCPGAEGVTSGEWFGDIDRARPYFVSCQAAIWRVSILRQLLDDLASFVPHATAADFELRGTPVLREYPYSVWSSVNGDYVVDYLCSAITRGEWTRDALKYCSEIGIDLTKTGRKVMSS